MARTFREAIAQVDGLEFDFAVGYEKIRPEAPQVDVEVAVAFADFDRRILARMARKLAGICRQQYQDAEDAVQDGFLHVIEHRSELLRQNPDDWMALLQTIARYRLLSVKAARRPVASIEKLLEDVGDGPFEDARPCVAETHSEDQRARHLPRPELGLAWTREEILGATVRFRDYWGRAPRLSDFTAINGLPSPTTVVRHFGSVREAILAAGMTPTSPSSRRKPYTEEEAVRICLAFRKREGRWPDWADVRREPGRLPSTTVLLRFFGGTRACDVQLGVEKFLAERDWA